MRIAACAMLAFAFLAAAGSLASAASCRDEIGTAKAAALADRCTQVSPATHPPCNVANACALIIGEIKRGCAMLVKDGAADTPGFCRSY